MWHQARRLVHGSSQGPSEAQFKRRLSHTCSNEVGGICMSSGDGFAALSVVGSSQGKVLLVQAATELLSKWAIFRMGGPAAGAALASQEAWAYVLKARMQAEPPTAFEQQALEQSCSTLFEVRDLLDARAAFVQCRRI